MNNENRKVKVMRDEHPEYTSDAVGGGEVLRRRVICSIIDAETNDRLFTGNPRQAAEWIRDNDCQIVDAPE